MARAVREGAGVLLDRDLCLANPRPAGQLEPENDTTYPVCEQLCANDHELRCPRRGCSVKGRCSAYCPVSLQLTFEVIGFLVGDATLTGRSGPCGGWIDNKFAVLVEIGACFAQGCEFRGQRQAHPQLRRAVSDRLLCCWFGTR